MVQHSGRRPWGQGLVQQVTGSLFLAGTELKQDTQLSWRRNQGKPRKPLLKKDRLDKAGCQVWGNRGPESRSICPRSCQHGQREMGLDPQAPFSFLYPQGSLAKLLTHKSSPTVWHCVESLRLLVVLAILREEQLCLDERTRTQKQYLQTYPEGSFRSYSISYLP